MALPAGTHLGAFQISSLIGAGGMGEVYRARDIRLERDVALKVLPESFAADEGRLARFRREAKVLAALDHPNIGALYDFQEQGGVHFLVMQLVEGETLAARIMDGPILLRRALPWFLQIAKALEAAHEKGIVHRDLKPANIKVSQDGSVRVIDFGIAKRFPPVATVPGPDGTDSSALEPIGSSTESTVAGTLSYMSPEQVCREHVDRRSDVWAFGCCLYITLTGRHPFEGESIWQTLKAILEHKPDFAELPDDVPDAVQSLLRRCLEKDPDRRLSSMGDIAASLEGMATELRRSSQGTAHTAAERGEGAGHAGRRLPGLRRGVIGTTAVFLVALATVYAVRHAAQDRSVLDPVAQPIRGIVVLPFHNLSADPEQEYFVDGMTDALTVELGKIRALKVISRTSAMRYMDSDKEVPQIAAELGVDAVIEGSVYRAGDDVRITAQLIDARTDARLWSDSYTGTRANTIKWQGEVALAIVDEIQVVVTPEEKARIVRGSTVTPDAYEALLRAKFFLAKHTPEGFRTAMEYAQDATNADPAYADAYACLSSAYWNLSISGYVRPGDAFPQAKALASKALSLDKDLATGHAAVGWTALFCDWDWDKAGQSFRRAVELNPNEPRAYQGLAWLSAVSGRYDDAIASMKKALELDPFWLEWRVALGHCHALAGEFEQAVEDYKKVLEFDPSYVNAHTYLSYAYMSMSRNAEAIASVNTALGLAGRTPRAVALLAYPTARSGRRDEVEALLQELYEKQAAGEYVQATYFAGIYSLLGETDEAFKWLEKGYEERAIEMVFLKSNTMFPELRSDPRFLDLLKRMEFPE